MSKADRGNRRKIVIVVPGGDQRSNEQVIQDLNQQNDQTINNSLDASQTNPSDSKLAGSTPTSSIMPSNSNAKNATVTNRLGNSTTALPVSQPSSNGSGMDQVTILSLIAGGVVVLALIIAFILWRYSRKRMAQEKNASLTSKKAVRQTPPNPVPPVKASAFNKNYRDSMILPTPGIFAKPKLHMKQESVQPNWETQSNGSAGSLIGWVQAHSEEQMAPKVIVPARSVTSTESVFTDVDYDSQSFTVVNLPHPPRVPPM
jgi:hypothetical protein